MSAIQCPHHAFEARQSLDIRAFAERVLDLFNREIHGPGTSLQPRRKLTRNARCVFVKRSVVDVDMLRLVADNRFILTAARRVIPCDKNLKGLNAERNADVAQVTAYCT